MKKFLIYILCFLVLTSCGMQDVTHENKDKTNTSLSVDAPISDPVIKQESVLEEKSDISVSTISPEVEDNSFPPESQTVIITVMGLDGILIYSAQQEYRDGLNVFDLLMETSKERSIPTVYSGGKWSPYITSIGGFAEKGHGPSSGWIYTVNGKSVMKPCNKYVLSPYDSVEWKYITEFIFE